MKNNCLVPFAIALLLSLSIHARADTFGGGENSFEIDFVTIGNAGNAADTTGTPNPAGSVANTFRMGQFEISEDMINKANAEGGLGLTHDNRGANKPATSISWFGAATFVNWLNTSTGNQPAYKFIPARRGSRFELWQSGDAGYDPSNLYRNSQATYFLPSVDEWYKAAYYDPHANGGVGGYWNFPTGSDTAPTPVASGSDAGTAVYDRQPGPADITLAGGLSPYGTMGQGGNVWEWEETDFDLVNDSTSSDRGRRGNGWSNDSLLLRSSIRGSSFPTQEDRFIGFRVAGIHEPSTLIGDFNGDGAIDLADFVIMAANFNTSPATSEQGDINFDRQVNLRDFLQFSRIFNAPAQGASASVPEPAGLTLALTGMAMIAAARTRKPTVRRGHLPCGAWQLGSD